MTIDEAALHRLLDLQGEDSAIKRLDEERLTLPEAARLAEVTDQLAELTADIEIATKQNDEVAREQTRLEGEIELLEQKTTREEQRMYSGNVANPKELSALQAEIEMLKKQRATIEDTLLEVMVQKDQSSGTLESLQAEHRQASEESATLTKVVGALTDDIDSQLREHHSKRDEVAASIPPDLLTMYDKLREQKHGVGAAALEAGTCQGCHTKLPAKEVERLKAEGGLQRCDNCRRILVVG